VCVCVCVCVLLDVKRLNPAILLFSIKSLCRLNILCFVIVTALK